jgi:hypothetical protein
LVSDFRGFFEDYIFEIIWVFCNSSFACLKILFNLNDKATVSMLHPMFVVVDDGDFRVWWFLLRCNLLALLSTSNIYYTALPKGFFLFKATKEGTLIIVGCMSTTTPIKGNNKQKRKTHKPFVRSTLGFFILILWFQKFGKNFQNFSIFLIIYTKGI